MFRILPVLLLVACSSGATDQAVDDYQVIVTDLTSLVASHGTAVQGAASVEAVNALEVSYQTDWDAVSARMGEHMAFIEGCEMSDADMGAMDDVTAMMADMDGMVADHVAAHATHTELTQCTADEDALTTDMSARTTSMAAHGEEWRTNMHCSGGGMDM